MSLGRLAVLALTLGVTGNGCGPSEPRPEGPVRLPVNVYADTGRGERLRIPLPGAVPRDARVAAAPRAAAWLTHVTSLPSDPAAQWPPLPAALPDTLRPDWPAPQVLVIDDGLKPPLPRSRTALMIPAAWRPRGRAAPAVVELDVRVDETGGVSAALPAGGSDDSLLVRAAVDCALGMRFYPALRAGQPVAVWCRQRFDFSAR